MYETLHSDGKTKSRIEYTVWSEVFTCPDCAGEVVFLDEALDQETKRVRDSFPCPHCTSELTKNRMERCLDTRFDAHLKSTVRMPKRRPSLISYKVGKQRYEKTPDNYDLQTIERIQRLPFPQEDTYRQDDACAGKRRLLGRQVARRYSLIFSRPSFVSAARRPCASRALAQGQRAPRRSYSAYAIVLCRAGNIGMSVLARYAPTHFSQVNQYLTGVYYMAAQHAECSPWYILDGKLSRLSKAFQSISPRKGMPHSQQPLLHG